VSARCARRQDEDRRGHSGQALYEFAMLVPVFLLIVLAMLEFGFMFLHHLTLEYATREGARAGAALANGSQSDQACVSGGGSVGAGSVDKLIVAAVQRVVESPGSQIDLGQISEIRIYKADANGDQIGSYANVWGPYSSGAGPSLPCVASAPNLDFLAPASAPYGAASRLNGAAPDSIGVAITYTYQFRTPLGGILRFLGGSGWSSITMTDRTVMALEPTT